MAAPSLDIDKEAVRVLVHAVGVREAARRMNLSEDTVKSWSSRGKWLAQPTPTPIPPTQRRIAPIAPISPADAMKAALEDDSVQTKVALSKGLRRVAEHVQGLEPGAALASGQNVKAIAASADLVHGWSAARAAGSVSQVMVNVNLLGLELAHEPIQRAGCIEIGQDEPDA